MGKMLSKSKYMAGLESHALLWTLVNNSERISEPDMVLQDKFDEGHNVGELAKKLFSSGVDLSDYDFLDNVNKTKELLNEGKVLFECVFLHGRCHARFDILVPNKDGFDLIEVKSTTGVKSAHIDDLAFQKYLAEKNGLIIKNVYVLHLNNEYFRGKSLDLKSLFKQTDVTPEVFSVDYVELKIAEFLRVIDLPECPDFNVEDYPKSDYGNIFIDEFLESLPEGNVFELYRVKRKTAVEMYLQGIHSLRDIQTNYKTNNNQQIQIKAQENVYVDVKQIKDFISGLTKPIIHLDFESFSLAIPEYEKTKPYQHLPFQYSMHIEHESGEVEHKEFLYEKEGDPRETFIQTLIKDLPKEGTILVFHKAYEIPRLNEIARDFPKYQEEIHKIVLRIQDLKDPFSNFWYHNKKQRGSNSIKNILPVFSDKTHKGLVVSNGSEAMILYKKNRGKLTSELRKDLLDYCELDTEAMLIILKGLRSVIK
ncbi:DUF2779 domain-containing protein [Candidatus Woesearchaeota archaeon]|nr:DUF2779 domain-containing protein [Candidatus Woesearchaeota archaeon]